MSIMLATDNDAADHIRALAPHKNMYEANRPRSLTSVATMPKPTAATITSWLSHKRPLTNDPVKRAFLEKLAS